MTKSHELYGDAIDTYTLHEALADGSLLHPYPKVWQWLVISRGVHAACVKEAEKGERTFDQCLKALLEDVIMQSNKVQLGRRTDRIELEFTVAGDVAACRNEEGGITVFQIEED